MHTAYRNHKNPDSTYKSLKLTEGSYDALALFFNVRCADLSQIEVGPFLSYTRYPVFRIPNTITRFDNDSQDFAERYEVISRSLLFDLQTDPQQEHPIDDPALERMMCEKLAQAMQRHDSPAEQYLRLGLTRP